MSIRKLKDDIADIRRTIRRESRYDAIATLEKEFLREYYDKMNNIRNNREGIYVKAVPYDNIVVESAWIAGLTLIFIGIGIAFKNSTLASSMFFALLACIIRSLVNADAANTILNRDNTEYKNSPYDNYLEFVRFHERMTKIADDYKKKEAILVKHGYYDTKPYSIAVGACNTAHSGPAEPAAPAAPAAPTPMEKK